MDNETKNLVLPASILIAAIIIAAAVYSKKPADNGNGESNAGTPNADLAQVLKLALNDAVLGDPKAKVTVIEYGDYQCPFCERFFKNVEPRIKEDYVNSGKVKFVYRNYILIDQITGGSESQLSAEAAECAKDQGQDKFWSYHDALYASEGKDGKEGNGNLNRALFMALAAQTGLNLNDFASCFDSHVHAKQIQEQSSAIGQIGTPTVFVNGKELSGVDPRNPYGQYKTAIDNALQGK